MAKVDVAAVAENDAAAAKIQEEMTEAESAVRERAHHLALEGSPGTDPDIHNWLRAEQQLFCVPSCELLERNGQFRLLAVVPGLEARQLQLTALPGTIVIKAARATESQSGDLHFSEFNRNELLRRIDLPSPIDITSVKARLERGVLELVAAKQAEAPAAAASAVNVKRPGHRTKKTIAKPASKVRRAGA